MSLQKFTYFISCVIFITQLSFAQNATKKQPINFNWDFEQNQAYLGYNFWSNSLLDWFVNDNRVNIRPFYNSPRTSVITSHYVAQSKARLQFSVDLLLSDNLKDSLATIGIVLGLGDKNLPHRTNNVVHHTNSPGNSLVFGIRADHSFVIYDYKKAEFIFEEQLDSAFFEDHDMSVKLHANFSKRKGFKIKLTTYSGLKKSFRIPIKTIPLGSIGLFANSKNTYKVVGYIDNMAIWGKALQRQTNRAVIGPILSSLYTVTTDSLFLSAQLMPFLISDADKIMLTLIDANNNKYNINPLVNQEAKQALFRIPLPQLTNNSFKYKITYSGKQTPNEFTYSGTIKLKNDKPEQTIMALTCNGYPFYKNDLNYSTIHYPYEQISKAYKDFKPDVLTFLGDQIYESRPHPPFIDADFIAVDYLYKWYLWCYMFREITANTPTIVLTDDHDVFQGNLWGNNNTSIKKDSLIPDYYGAQNNDTWLQDLGGYIYGNDFVNMIFKTQTAHLPYPYNPAQTNGLNNYYTSYDFGQLSFLILEDKKFKSPPTALNLKSFNGFALNKSSPIINYEAKNLKLLGDNQLKMIANWRNNTIKTKIVLTQSAFASLTTTPHDFNTLNDKLAKKDSLAQIVSPDMDTNGWPKVGRDKALSAFNDSSVLFLSGDQHLAAVVQLFDTSNTPYTFFSVPSIANTWPRVWSPKNGGLENQLGFFTDAFGNKLNVKAVVNPDNNVAEPIEINSRMPGFGIIKINTQENKAKLYAYPLNYDLQPQVKTAYKGFPIHVKLK